MRYQFYVRLFTILSLFWTFMSTAHGQDPYPEVDISNSDEMGQKGDTVCVSFTAKDFTDVEGFGFQISFNSNILEAVSPVRFPDSRVPDDYKNSLTVVFNQAPLGRILFNYYGDALTLPDGVVLFELCFKIIGNPGDMSPVFFNLLYDDTGIIRPLIPGGNTVQSPFTNKNGSIKVVASQLTISRSVCDATNATNDNGVIEFSVGGGVQPYSYTVSSGPSGSGLLPGQRIRLENLPMGNYVITVTDAMGTMRTQNINISNTLPYTYTLTGKDPDCSNRDVPNGSAIIEITNAGPYNKNDFKYEWSNFVFNTTDNINLSNGKYYVTIIDPSGCRAYDSTEIFREPISVDFMITREESCPGQGDGEVMLTITGGLPFAGNQYEVREGGIPIGRRPASIKISGIRGGDRFINVIDSLNCFATIEFFMPTRAGILIDTLNQQDVSCFDGGDGKISIKASEAGNTNFMFILHRNNVVIFGGVASNDMFTHNNLIEGNYSITITSVGTGCIRIFTFTIGQPLEINLTDVNVINPSCQNNIGSITLNPTGGMGPFTFEWSHDSLNKTNSASSLSPGNYAVTVTDSKGCSRDTSFLLLFDGMGTAPLVNARVETPISCFGGNDGAVAVDVVPPTPTPMYEWRRFGQTTVLSMSAIMNNLSAGTYVVEVSNGTCTVLDTIVLNDPPGMDITLNVVTPTCPGLMDGSIGAMVTGGNPNYSYQWFPTGSQTPIGINSVLAPISAGSYDLVLIDSKLCRQDTTIILTDPAKIDLQLLEVNQVNCFGFANGRADVIATGGTQANPTFNYLWSSSPTDSGPLAFNLPAGTNWVIAFDNICVSDTVFFEVPSVEKLRLDPETVAVDPSCYGSTDGIITAIAMGGTEMGYRFNWIGVPNGDTSIIENLGAGKYYVNILDTTGCTALDSVTLDQPDSLAVNQNPLATHLLSCRNMDNGQIGVVVTGGNQGMVLYQWNIANQNGPIISGLSTGNYCVTATDSKGCTADYCYELTSPPPVRGRVAEPAEPDCFGDKTELCVDFITGGTGNSYTFQINQGQRFPADSCVSLFAGTYTINLIDSAGCFIDTVITINQPNPISIELPESIEVLLGEKSDLIVAQVQSPFGVSSIQWIPFDSEIIECVTPTCEAVIFSPINTTIYEVIVTDLNNCTAIGEIEVIVKDVRNVFFPNIFAPKAEGGRNGFNSYFNVAVGPGVTQVISFEIYDRWGNQVFSKYNYMPDGSFSDGWDGTFHGQLLNSAVFAYRAVVLFSDGKEIPYTGAVTLLR